MKTALNKFSILSLFLLTLFACEKEEDRMILEVGAPPALSTTASNLVLTEEEAESEAITISWTEAEFGYPAAVTYTLEVDTAGDGFQQPYTVNMGSELSRRYTVAEFNSLLTKMGYAADEAQEVPFRLKASISDKIDPVYSNVETITVTPYSTFVEPGYIYVPGAYQGWNPGTAPALISVENNDIYQGIVTITNEGPEGEKLQFKFTDERSWDLNWGAGEEEGTLAVNGPNLMVPEADSYMLTVDLNTLTWSATQHSWGLVGDATGSWDVDQNMTFDNEEGVWRITTDLSVGKVKFRFNDDWALNYGDDDTSNNALNKNGADIPIAEAGTYEIVLDVSDEENPTYSITKI